MVWLYIEMLRLLSYFRLTEVRLAQRPPATSGGGCCVCSSRKLPNYEGSLR